MWLLQKPSAKVKKIKGAYKLKIILSRPDARRRDLGNYEKALSDILQTMGIIENDYLCREQHLVWGTRVDAPSGARLILTKIDS